MDTVETLKEYDHIFSRLRKLNKNILKIAHDNKVLREINAKLRTDNGSLITQAAARERVLQGVQAKLDALAVDSDDRI